MKLSTYFNNIKEILERMISETSYEEIEKIKQKYTEEAKNEHGYKVQRTQK